MLFHPKVKKDAAGEVVEEKKSEVVVQPTSILAGSPEEVGMMAAGLSRKN